MWQEWFKREMISEFWWESCKKGGYFEDVLLDGKMNYNKSQRTSVLWRGFLWFGIRKNRRII